MISYQGLGLYNNSIDIEITPEDLVNYLYEDTIPDVVNIAYCDLTDIIDLFNSPRGYEVLDKALKGEITLNLFPTDSVGLNQYELDYLKGHEVIFRKPNINLYQTWYDPDIKFKYHLGCTIHTALSSFIFYYKDVDFNPYEKTKHFLTLNNLHTPVREELFKLYDSLSDGDKEKFICSFIFSGIELDKNLPSIMNEYESIFGKKGGSHYDTTLIEIVSESSEIAITEKSYKPLIIGIPFIHYINNLDGTNHQVEYLKDIGIDTKYFGIDYSDKVNVENKIKELLSMTLDEIRDVYSEDFEKAKENKKIFLNFVSQIENDLIKK
jgi:hypothetical protein